MAFNPEIPEAKAGETLATAVATVMAHELDSFTGWRPNDFILWGPDLFADNYFGYFAQLCRRNELLMSVEPYDGPFECLLAGRDAHGAPAVLRLDDVPGYSSQTVISSSVCQALFIKLNF